MSDADLERRLSELGELIEFPRTPDLATRVTARLRARPERPWWQRWLTPWPRAVAVALAVAVVAFVVSLAVSPDARQAVADRLGIGGVRITQVREVPTLAPRATPSSTPLSPGATLNLGTAVSLDEARRRFGAVLLVPELGPPDAVYMAGDQEVSLVYVPRADLPAASGTRGVGAVLSQFRASLDLSIVAQKGLGPGTSMEEVQVGGNRAVWIAGAPHLFLRTQTNVIRDVPARLAGNTLLWEHNGVTLRLESGLDRDAAIRIAEQLK